MERKLLVFLVFTIVALNLFSSIFILFKTQQALQNKLVSITARAANEGQVAFCVNQQPSLSVSCNTTMVQDRLYTCQLNVSDPDGSNLSFFQIPQAPDDVSIFNISSTGLINFTPTNNDTGNHSTKIGVDDNSGCENAYAYYLFNFTVGNVNDPPYLVTPIPNQSFSVNTTLVAFFLSDYFVDPDGDPLTYTIQRGLGDVFVNVTLRSDSSVLFTASDCGTANFQFTAFDPRNLSAESNNVRVEVVCPGDTSSGSATDTGGSGAGAGGGGGSVCIPELICLPWSECYPNGMQVQTCKDKNGCDAGPDDKVKELKFYRNCTYEGTQPECVENWLCSDWGVCRIDGHQNRTCTDLAACGTTLTKPPLEQECTYQPTCFDGVKNGNETGVDCGGPCKPCATIQHPSILPAESRFATLLFLAVIIVLAVLLALFVLYRERIYEELAELGWLLARKRKKEILLSPAEKRSLFEALENLEERRFSLAPAEVYELLSKSVRTFYSMVFDLPFEYELSELGVAFDRLKLPSDVHELLTGFHERLLLLESQKLRRDVMDDALVMRVLEEQRLLVCMLSDYEVSEIERELPERHITEELSFGEEITLRLLNAYEALQFQFLDQAQSEYKLILRAYENLNEPAQRSFYDDIRRLYLEIRYVAETSEEGSF